MNFNKLKKRIRKYSLGLPQVIHEMFHITQRKRNILKVKDNAIGERFACVIFSKDRPLQLYACLESYFKLLKNAPIPVVIYQSSNEDFERAYLEIQRDFSSRDVKFYRENIPFNVLLKDLINSLICDRIFFLVDDIVFIREFDLNSTLKINPRNSIFSMRLGQSINFCYTHQKSEKLPSDFSQRTDGFADWTWNQGILDWSYPLSVDGHIFAFDEFQQMITDLNFKAPNSLEAGLQKFNSIYKNKKGTCFSYSVLVNNPCNKVQNENENISGGVHQDDLLKVWGQGFKIDTSKYLNLIPSGVHQELEFFFIRRES